MIVLETVSVKNFFWIDEASISLKDRGLVLVHGRVGAGKTALLCESVLYGLYGTSFEYGQKPGTSVMKRTAKEFFVEVVLSSDSGRFKIRRGKFERLNGVELLKEDESGVFVPITGGTSKITQQMISKDLLGMSESLFRKSVICSTDMARFPDASDAEKKEIFDELLELWRLQKAFDETAANVKELKREKERLEASVRTARARVQEAEEGKRHSSKALRKKVESLRADMGEAEDYLSEVKAKYLGKRERLAAALANVPSTTVPDTLHDAIAAARSAIKEHDRISDLIERGHCPECGQETGSVHLHEPRVALEERLRSLLEEREELVERGRAEEAERRRLNQKLERLKEQFDGIAEDIRRDISKTAILIERVTAMVEAAKLTEGRIEELEEELSSLEKDLASVTAKLTDEEVLQGIFSKKGCRNSIIRSVIPFLNEEAERVAIALGAPMRVTFSIKEEDEAFTGSLAVEVNNPTGACRYHGSSAGERRTIDLIIMMCFISMAGRRNTRFNQSFFDETFEKMDAPLQRSVLGLLRSLTSDKSSVFIITHAAEEVRLLVDEHWEVQKGGIVTITKN